MNTLEESFVNATEGHCLDEIRALLDAGLPPDVRIRGRTLINWLTKMYSRSDRFADCLRILLERGAKLDDPYIAPVSLDDAVAIKSAIHTNPGLLQQVTTLTSAFTPLVGASLLHVAAEYGHLNAVRALLEVGADPDARAATDEYGLNGHTPLFHTVNSSHNRSQPIMRLRLEAGARPDTFLPGITWGKGFEWETTCFDVTPISYCQMGLLPQVHREDGFGSRRVAIERLSAPCPVLTPNGVPTPMVAVFHPCRVSSDEIMPLGERIIKGPCS